MQFEYFNARLLQNTALKIKQTVGAVTPPDGYAFGVLSALTNLETTNSDLVENVNSVYVNTLDIKIPTEETMVEYVEYVFEHDAAKRDSVIIKSNTIPAASAELLGYEYQYMGETNNTYTHGFVYECKDIPTDTLVFTPNTVSCDWANLSAFLQTETADYNSVVAGSMTYFADAELWRATFTDANGDTVLTYQQYTGDWENVGFEFTGTFQDGDVVSFVRHTEFDYVWERVDLQPNHEQDIIELQTNVAEIQSVIPAQATPTNKLVAQDTITPMQQQINHLQTIGRFLSFWDATTGLAQTNPQTSPYIYQTGDYFRVGVVASGGATNYRPTGSSYTIGVASTVVETNPLTVGQVYYYDGTNWGLAAGGSVAIDGTTIVFNSDNEIQALAVIDQNTGIAKTWTGMKMEYDAIATKDPETEYIVTDDIGSVATDIGRITEDINDLKEHTVVEFQAPTAENNYTWYRKYADSWVEQGGFSSGEPRTATLPVAMADTNYSVICVQRGTTAPTASEGSPRAGAISTTQIYVNGGGSSNNVCWQVSGMAA